MELEVIKSGGKTYKYEKASVVYALRGKGMADCLRAALDLYKSDEDKWQDWYENEVVVPNKLIPLGKVCEWIRTKAKSEDYSHDEIDFDALADDLIKAMEE